jgi:lysophospholipase L1-like esterase
MLTAALILLLQNPATTPQPRTDRWWQERHAACVEATKAHSFDVAFLGDSITQGWESAGKAAWSESFAPLKAANFGFSGDRTEHALWRLDNGEIAGGGAKVIVVMIGTNNLGTNSPAQTADGVVAIVDQLLAKTSGKVLLLGIFPRSVTADHPLRLAAAEATRGFWDRCENPRVTRMDIGSHFIRSDGTLRTLLMPDALHLNENGYRIWAKAILPTVARLLDNP